MEDLTVPDVEKWIPIAQKCQYLPEKDLKVGRIPTLVDFYLRHTLFLLQKLCDVVCDLLLEESNVQPVSTPVTVCGDIHGQVRERNYRLYLVYVQIL